MRKYTIRGKSIHDIKSLCDEFARVVDAPRGYFGRNLFTFDDCLFHPAYGLETPCEVIWEDHHLSQKGLDASMLASYCQDTLKEFEGMDAEEEAQHAEGIAYCKQILAQAESGEKTMFDEVLETLESVTSRSQERRKLIVVLR